MNTSGHNPNQNSASNVLLFRPQDAKSLVLRDAERITERVAQQLTLQRIRYCLAVETNYDFDDGIKTVGFHISETQKLMQELQTTNAILNLDNKTCIYWDKGHWIMASNCSGHHSS